VEAEGIDGVVHGLVGAAEAEEVGRHDAVPAAANTGIIFR